MKKLGELFNIDYGQREYHNKTPLEGNIGNTPLISSSGTNNGVYGYFNILPKYNHVVSVPNTGTIGYAFYQGEECCIDDNCLVMSPKEEMTAKEMLFFALLVRKNKHRFMYGRQITPKRLGALIIPDMIPSWVDDHDLPDYSHIKESLSQEKVELNTPNWKAFRYDELFNIRKGKRLTKEDMIEGNTPFIGSSEFNNGLTSFVGQTPIHKGNTISLAYDGSVGEAFYQPVPFWALDSVNVLYPRFELNKYIAMFLISIIRKEKYRFNYGRKWKTEIMRKSIMKLPVDSEGNPDWQYMEDYIKSLPWSAGI